MLRRDFLKFIGVAGTSLALPGISSIEPLAVIESEVNSAFDSGKLGMLLGFEFYDFLDDTVEREWIAVQPLEGNFTYQEHYNPRYFMDEGLLKMVEPEREPFDFDLDLQIEKISHPDLIGKIKGKNCFNMQIEMNNTKYKLHECFWECLEYDLTEGLLSIQGRMKNLILEAR